MKKFKYALVGVLSVLAFLPILKNIWEIVDLWMDTLKLKSSRKFLEYQKDVVMMSEFIDPSSQHQNDNDVYFIEVDWDDLDDI